MQKDKQLNELKKTLENFKKKLEEIKNNEQEFKNKYLRALADYQNFEKRVSEEKKNWYKNIKKELILKILPILDSIEKAEIFVKDTGLKLIKDQFVSFLNNEGVKEINILGKNFDPYLAEAVDVILGEKDNVVVEVLRKGYFLEKEIIRPAQVKVSKVEIDEKAKIQL